MNTNIRDPSPVSVSRSQGDFGPWRLSRERLEWVPCPLCGGSRFVVLATTDRYDMDLQTVGCRDCGLAFTNPQPTAFALDDFYAASYRTFYQQAEKPSLEYIRSLQKDERAKSTAQFLTAAAMLRPGQRILDVGASEGCILRALRERVPGLSLTAIEPNEEFAAFARDYAQCETFHSLEALLATRPQPFDLIVINHVLEHIKMPAKLLRELLPLVSAGQIYVDVPQVEAYRRLDALHIAHLLHFSPHTLHLLAAAAGYECVLLEEHLPLRHPTSLRALLKPVPGMAKPVVKFQPAGWRELVRIERRATLAHGRRWSFTRRVRHLLRWLLDVKKLRDAHGG